MWWILSSTTSVAFFHSGNPDKHEVVSRVSGTPFCLGGRLLKRHVQTLQNLEVGLVVNMTREWDPNGLKRCFETHHIEWKHYPTVDTEVPKFEDLLEGARAIAKWCEADANKGKKVYIHCKGGRSRSACMAAACLIHMGLCKDIATAVAKLSEARPVVDQGVIAYKSLRQFATPDRLI